MDETGMKERHASLLGQRVAKAFRHYKKRFEKQQIGCFRLYDWTIPEVRAKVDYFEGHVVVSEYVRQQTEQVPGYLEALGEAVRLAIGAEATSVHLRRRQTRQGGSSQGRYERLGSTGKRFVVRERDARFWVNLDDYLDAGFFADQRETRALVRSFSAGKSVLNLYCYTGSFTVAAALGGARETTSVDLSESYLKWAQDNLELNQLSGPQHRFVTASCDDFLKQASDRGQCWDCIVVDPPSFSTVGSFSSSAREFDILEAHPGLLDAALRCLAPGGRILFSTNHQRFEPFFDGLDAVFEEITHRTVPEDFRSRGSFQKSPVHRSFLLRRK